METSNHHVMGLAGICILSLAAAGAPVLAAQPEKVVSSYGPINQNVTFSKEAPRSICMMMAHDGPIKTFPLRGIKDSPPYLHDGRCFTLEDTVEYFNIVQRLHLAPEEKKDLVEFMRCL